MLAGKQSASSRILVLCDEPMTSRVWGLLLVDLGCQPVVVRTLQEAIAVIDESAPDVIVIDLISRAASGPDLCRQVREHAVAPLLLLTPINNEGHTLEAYQAGCDECVIKPISPALFLAKIRVWLHRAWTVQADSLDRVKIGDMSLLPSGRVLENTKGERVKLSNLEFRILHLLMNHPDRIFSSEEIADRAWGSYGGNAALVKNLMYRLRRKIEPDPNNPKHLKTNTGGGYLFRIIPEKD